MYIMLSLVQKIPFNESIIFFFHLRIDGLHKWTKVGLELTREFERESVCVCEREREEVLLVMFSFALCIHD